VVAAERKLREGTPAVVARVEDGKLMLDLRTVLAEEEEPLASALQGIV